MKDQKYLDSLYSEIGQIKSLLKEIPEEDVIERDGLQARLEMIRNKFTLEDISARILHIPCCFMDELIARCCRWTHLQWEDKRYVDMWSGLTGKTLYEINIDSWSIKYPEFDANARYKVPVFTSSLDAMFMAERWLSKDECILYNSFLKEKAAKGHADDEFWEVECSNHDFHISPLARATCFLKACMGRKWLAQHRYLRKGYF